MQLKFGSLIGNSQYTVDVDFCQNQMLFVGVMQMCINRGVYSCNIIL